MGLDEDAFASGAAGWRDGDDEADDCDFPPSRKPLPLNGMTFRMSCDPETEG